MMIFTDCGDSEYSDLGSSEDDSVLTDDEEDGSDISCDELDCDVGNDVAEKGINILQEGGLCEQVDDIVGNWKRGRFSSSTSGEWARLYTGLQKWHGELSEEWKQFVGPLTKPYRR